MRAIRRLLRVVAFAGTLLVGIVALALIVSQTPWFRDWLRRYIVRESKQYVNGELAIGHLGGNLLFGVDLTDVTVDVSGERIIAVKALELDYSVFQLVSAGIVLDGIKIDQPVVRLERDANGWNLARLVKRERKEADREGPRRPVSLPVIEITGASLSIDDRTPPGTFRLPSRIEGLDMKAGFEYAPVHYTVTMDKVSFRGKSPELTVQQLTGKVAVRDDNLYLDGIALKTSETAAKVDGVIERYLSERILKLTTTGNVSLPEIGRIMPVLAGYNLHPVVNVKMTGPIDRLALSLDVKSEAGKVRGQVTADLKTPDLAVRGEADLERLNIAPIVKDPARKTDLTGHAKVDIVIASQPAGLRVVDRMRGTFTFNGPHAAAEGYEARDVRVSGSLAGPRITLDAARGAAYGGTATARGYIVTPAPGRQLAFDLQGRADNLDLRRLPASLQVPELATTLSVAEYHVTGQGPIISGTATLNESVVEGATFASGTAGEFSLTPGEVSYGARGTVADLDLDRFGAALEVEALAKPMYDSRINGSFDVRGIVPRTTGVRGSLRSATPKRGTVEIAEAAGPRAAEAPSVLSTMTLDASGRLTNSDFLGGRLPDLTFDAHMKEGDLTGRADGRFEGFNPAQLTGRKELDGKVTGTVNTTFAIRDVTEPITPEAVTADGKLALFQSTVGGLQLDTADVVGRYAAQVGDITRLNVTGPDVKVDASGRLALDRTSASSLKYHVEAINLTELARLAGQTDVGGTAILDGSITGNAASFVATGTLDGSNLSYQKNNALDLNSRYTVTVPDLDFVKAHVQATTDATFVTVSGMQLNSVTATTTYDQQHLEFTTHIKEKTRELDATGQLVLHPDHQEIHLPQLAVRTQGVEWRTAPGSEAAIKYGRGLVELENVRLISGDQSLEVSGSLALGGEKPTGGIEVHARNVDLQQLETLLLQNRGFSGKLTADAKITGSTAAPAIDGRIAIEKGGFKSYRYDSLVANVDYRGTRVGIDATLQQSPTESITARGSVPTSLFRASPGGGHVDPPAGEQVDLQIKSTAIALAIVEGLTDLVTNVTGTLEADVHVTGSAQDPHLDGFIDIKNGGFGVPDLGGTFSGLTTRIALEPDIVRIQQFQLLDHHGEKLTIAGELAVHERQVGAVNVSIDSDNFELLDNELGDVQAQMALKITGEVRRPRITGEVRLDAGRIEVDRVLQLFYDPYALEALPEVVSAEQMIESSGSAEEATKQSLAKAQQSAAPPGEAEKAQEPTQAPGGLFEAVELDIRLLVPDNLVLRGNDLRPGGPTGTALGDMNITVGGDVRVRKSPGGPVTPIGTVNTVRGSYQFQGRRFDLARDGTIRFIGTTLNPMLDITATRKIPNTGVEARVRITGTPQAPQLALSSTPALEESDILALIVFNRPVNELGSGERSSLAATAGGIATGFIAAPLGESIGKALDLDLFEITTTTDSGDLGAGVTLGQQLGDRAFIKLRQQFGERSFTEFLIEYQLADFLRLQATGSPETTGSANRVNQRRVERAGIDLIFFFSY
jgi:autotransporter translocation and assembly factor TamB